MVKNATKSDHQREKIISIAREMFAENGFEATTTRKINQEAGIAEGLMYYYFPHGKREILDTIVYQGITERMKQVHFTLTDCESTDDLEQRLLTVFKRVWSIFQNEENYQSFMITIRERMLLSQGQADWLLGVLNGLVDQIAVQFKAISTILPIQSDQCHPLARVVVSIYQKVIYDELLIKNNRHMTPEITAQLQPQLHLVLGLLQAA